MFSFFDNNFLHSLSFFYNFDNVYPKYFVYLHITRNDDDDDVIIFMMQPDMDDDHCNIYTCSLF